jgi:hypothetical protein
MKKSELQALVSALPDDVDVEALLRQLRPRDDIFASRYFQEAKPQGWELDSDRGFESGQSSPVSCDILKRESEESSNA